MDYYHVRLTPKSDTSQVEVRLDLNIDELTERFVLPYRRGLSITINGRSFSAEDVERIRINKTDQDSQYLLGVVSEERDRRASQGIIDLTGSNNARAASKGEDVTDEFITGPPGHEAETAAQSSLDPRPSTDAREVFVVHGRNETARGAIFTFLRSIGLTPLEWAEAVQDTGMPSPYIGEILDVAFSRAHAVVVLFTPDDEARLRDSFQSDNDPPYETELTGQARPNVLFEAGMAMARSQDRTILVELGQLRPFSDVAGRHTIRLDNTSQRRQVLAQRLQAAGCPVNLNGIDWHSAGDFDGAIVRPIQASRESSVNLVQGETVGEVLNLSDDAKALLTEATNDRARMIRRLRMSGGLSISTHGKSFGEIGDGRSEARWEQAIRDLLGHGLVEDPTGEGKVFEVTHRGFQSADVPG